VSECLLRLVWRSGNGVRHINEVKLRRARLVLGLVTTWHLSTPVRPTQPGHPSVGRCNDCTGDGFGHLWEETAPLKLQPYGAL